MKFLDLQKRLVQVAESYNDNDLLIKLHRRFAIEYSKATKEIYKEIEEGVKQLVPGKDSDEISLRAWPRVIADGIANSEHRNQYLIKLFPDEKNGQNLIRLLDSYDFEERRMASPGNFLQERILRFYVQQLAFRDDPSLIDRLNHTTNLMANKGRDLTIEYIRLADGADEELDTELVEVLVDWAFTKPEFFGNVCNLFRSQKVKETLRYFIHDFLEKEGSYDSEVPDLMALPIIAFSIGDVSVVDNIMHSIDPKINAGNILSLVDRDGDLPPTYPTDNCLELFMEVSSYTRDKVFLNEFLSHFNSGKNKAKVIDFITLSTNRQMRLDETRVEYITSIFNQTSTPEQIQQIREFAGMPKQYFN